MTKAVPIVCYLTDNELQRRRRDHLGKLAASLIDHTELTSGFSYRFPLGDSILRDLAEVIDLERKCCPFLSFQLTVESENPFVQLELTGPDGTKEMIKTLFEWN